MLAYLHVHLSLKNSSWPGGAQSGSAMQSEVMQAVPYVNYVYIAGLCLTDGIYIFSQSTICKSAMDEVCAWGWGPHLHALVWCCLAAVWLNPGGELEA